MNPRGEVTKFKARLVAKGFLQKQGLDYDEVFAPIARLETVRLVIAMASYNCWEVHQMDVKSAFLNGSLEEEVFVTQPPGFVMKGRETEVYKLHKALDGLKQAPRAWNKRIDTFLLQIGFMRCTTEYGVYVKGESLSDILIVCLYVDDLLITGKDCSAISTFKQEMKSEFEMSDLGELSYFLGIEFKRTKAGIFMHQSKYTIDVLKRFQMLDCNSVSTPVETSAVLDQSGLEKLVDKTMFRQMVGSLRYICNTRPDVAYGVGLVSRFLKAPLQGHLNPVKRLLRYLKGTIGFGLLFPTNLSNNSCEMIGFSDADWCGDKTDRKSTTGYLFQLGNAAISWCSKKQSVVALSSCEAEYIAASMSACQAIWLEALLDELKVKSENGMLLMVDNKSAISLAKNPVAHGRSKHIETRFHYLRDQVYNGRLRLDFCRSADQLVDILTKPLKKERFEDLRRKMGLRSSNEI